MASSRRPRKRVSLLLFRRYVLGRSRRVNRARALDSVDCLALCGPPVGELPLSCVAELLQIQMEGSTFEVHFTIMHHALARSRCSLSQYLGQLISQREPDVRSTLIVKHDHCQRPELHDH